MIDRHKFMPIGKLLVVVLLALLLALLMEMSN